MLITAKRSLTPTAEQAHFLRAGWMRFSRCCTSLVSSSFHISRRIPSLRWLPSNIRWAFCCWLWLVYASRKKIDKLLCSFHGQDNAQFVHPFVACPSNRHLSPICMAKPSAPQSQWPPIPLTTIAPESRWPAQRSNSGNRAWATKSIRRPIASTAKFYAIISRLAQRKPITSKGLYVQLCILLHVFAYFCIAYRNRIPVHFIYRCTFGHLTGEFVGAVHGNWRQCDRGWFRRFVQSWQKGQRRQHDNDECAELSRDAEQATDANAVSSLCWLPHTFTHFSYLRAKCECV